MYEIPGMTDKNESGLVFLGENYFAIPNLLEAEDSGDEEDEENSDSEEDNGENQLGNAIVETAADGDKGYSIHRITDGKQICFLPD